MRLTVFALLAAATVGVASAANEFDAAESEHLLEFWSKFMGWKWNCSAWGKHKAHELNEAELEKAGEEPEWLAKEWVSKMMLVKHHAKHNISDFETGKLAKMWPICNWFKFKWHKDADVAPQAAGEVNEEALEKADEQFLLDFWTRCKWWKTGKNFTWFKTHKDGAEDELTAEIVN